MIMLNLRKEEEPQKENPIDRLLRKKLQELSLHSVKQAPLQKNFTASLIEKIKKEGIVPSSHSSKKLHLSEWLDILKEIFFYSERASLHWAPVGIFVLAFLFFWSGSWSYTLQKDESPLGLPVASLEKPTKKPTKKPEKNLTKKSEKKPVPALTALRTVSSKELDSKEEELLLNLETAKGETEKLAALRALKAHYVIKKAKGKVKKIQIQIDKLSETRE